MIRLDVFFKEYRLPKPAQALLLLRGGLAKIVLVDPRLVDVRGRRETAFDYVEADVSIDIYGGNLSSAEFATFTRLAGEVLDDAARTLSIRSWPEPTAAKWTERQALRVMARSA